MDDRMTDYQFRTMLEMVLTILKKSENLDEAIREIETLAAKDNSEK